MDAARESVRRLLDLVPYDTAQAARLGPFPSDPAMTARYVDHLRAAGLPEPQ